MEEFDKKLGEYIRTKRREARLSQQVLATMIGVSKNQIGKYERGENRITVAQFMRISNALLPDADLDFAGAIAYIHGVR